MKEYTYSVARVRAKETELFTHKDIEQLISSGSYEEAQRIVDDRKRGSETLWEFMHGIVDDELLNVLRMPIDFHNIKASVKSVFSQTSAEELLVDGGTVDRYDIYHAVKSRNYNELPEVFGNTAEMAMTTILRTQDGQLCDLYIDKAQLAELEKQSAKSNDSFLIKYTTMNADASNLKTAMRCAVMDKSKSFIENALYNGGSLNYDSLVNAAESGIDALEEFILLTPFRDGAPLLKNAPAFEKFCDDILMHYIESAKYESFSSAPILAYAHARLTEEKTIDMILSALQSHISRDIIRERVRRLYV